MDFHKPIGGPGLLTFILLAFIVLFVALWTPPARSGSSARRAACASNLAQIGKALSIYADANNGALPSHLEDLWPSYIKDPAVFQSPILRKQKQSGPPPSCDYLYLPECAKSRTGVVAFGPKEQKGSGRNVLIAGGSVEFITDDETFRTSVLEQLKAAGVSLKLEPDATQAERDQLDRLQAELLPEH